jgi:hypothetical protein
VSLPGLAFSYLCQPPFLDVSMFLGRVSSSLVAPCGGGVTLPEDVSRREAENSVTQALTPKDIEGLVRKDTLLEGELAEARRA